MPLPRNPIPPYIAERAWKAIAPAAEDECWPWPKSKGSHGYGQIGWTQEDGRRMGTTAHRAVWVHHYGPIPGQLTVDHICHNKVCCNPSHLRLLTNVDNATDNTQGSKTECPRGHPYNEENTYMDPNGHRRCRPCARRVKREWHAKTKAGD